MLFLVAMGERFKVRGCGSPPTPSPTACSRWRATPARHLQLLLGSRHRGRVGRRGCALITPSHRSGLSPSSYWDEIWSHGSGRRRRRMPVHRRTASLRSQAMRVQLTAAGRVGASASPRGDAGSRDGHAGGGGGRSPAASRRRDSANERRPSPASTSQPWCASPLTSALAIGRGRLVGGSAISTGRLAEVDHHPVSAQPPRHPAPSSPGEWVP